MGQETDRLAGWLPEYVRKVGGGTSFVELGRAEPAHFRDGQHAFASTLDTNIIFWNGLSQEGVDALMEALTGGEVWMEPSNHLVYLFDGGVLGMPMVEGPPPDGGFPEPRWLPVVLWHKSVSRPIR